MPVTKSAAKALRNQQKKREYNLKAKRKVKQVIKAFNESPSQKKLNQAYSAVDKAVKRNIFHKNKAARIKRQLAEKLPSPKKTDDAKKANKK
jgi:ribosomal protein S20